MSAMPIEYPPITNPIAVAEWRQYERRNAKANAEYCSAVASPECPFCGRLSDTRVGHAHHVRQCRYRS